MRKKTLIKQWRFSLILISAVAIGAITGYAIGPEVEIAKPLGDVFLNLLFTAVVPLVFFSLSSAVAASQNINRLGRIAGLMLAVFLMTGLISSCLMLAAVKIFDPAKNINIELTQPSSSDNGSLVNKIVNTLTVSDFSNLLSRQNIMALIVFSILTGLAAQAAGEKGRSFRDFLVAGAEVMGKLIKLIMLYAPIGLGVYFAYLVGMFGSKILGTYARAVMLYYPVSILYFIFGFSTYILITAGYEGVKRFWMYISPAALTAFGTGSSLAALPANLECAQRIGVPKDVREIVLTIGATIHMDGTCLAAVMKIAILFSLYGRSFSGLGSYAGAVGVSILCGVVMSGIPGGGFLGEALIVSMYGFGPEALPIISMLGTLVDPPATMINSTGDTVAAMMITPLLETKRIEDTHSNQSML